MRISRLLGWIAALAFPLFAANTPVTLNFTGSAPNPIGTTFNPGDAVGQITPFGTGAVAFSNIVVGSSAVTLNAVFSIQNGSTFGGTFNGTTSTNSPISNFTGPITTGTGIFQQATGTLNFQLNITNLSPTATVLNYNVSGSGTVAVQDVGSGLTVSPGGLVFATPFGNTTPLTQGVTLTNGSGPAIQMQASATGGSWLSVSPTSGTVSPYSSLPLAVSANTTGLRAGLYTGQVGITYPGGSSTVYVELVVGPVGTYIQLSQDGLYFAGNPSGAPPPSQTIVAINSGTGTLNGLSVAASTTDGGNWLDVKTTSTATSATAVVQPSLVGLQVGRHFGKVTFTLPGAPNSPQTTTVILDVAADQFYFEADPNMVTFNPEFATMQSPLSVTLFNAGNTPVTWSFQTVYTIGPPGWLTVTPSNGTVGAGVPNQSSQKTQVTLSVPTLSTMLPGTYEAFLRMTTSLPVQQPYTDVDVIVSIPSFQGGIGMQTGTPGFYGPEPSPYAKVGPRDATCTPTQVLARIARPPAGFQATVGLPMPVQAFVIDNCMIPVDAGSVSASFSTGDGAVKMTPIGNGMWTGTWVPQKSAAAATVEVQAQTASPILLAGKSAVGSVAAGGTDTPLITSGGVVSAASGTSPVAPGEFIGIFGANLAAGGVTSAPAGQAFPTALGGTQAFLGGRALPLYFTAAGQIDAVVPNDVPPNTIQQLIVQSGNGLSHAENVIVGAAQPSVFTQDQSGKGPGAILGQKPGGVAALNTPSNPASAGDALLIYCTGLGTTTPPNPAGTPASSTTLSYADNTVTATVGGKPAQVLFAGLAPGYVGLYQVNVIVPDGIAASSSVPVVLTSAGTDSPPVTVALK